MLSKFLKVLKVVLIVMICTSLSLAISIGTMTFFNVHPHMVPIFGILISVVAGPVFTLVILEYLKKDKLQ